MRSVQVEEVRVQLTSVSEALCTDGAFTLAERHPVTVTAQFFYSRNNFRSFSPFHLESRLLQIYALISLQRSI